MLKLEGKLLRKTMKFPEKIEEKTMKNQTEKSRKNHGKSIITKKANKKRVWEEIEYVTRRIKENQEYEEKNH